MNTFYRIKYLLVFVFAFVANWVTAQRDINHVQVTLQPGLIYTNNNIGTNISDDFNDFESDFYGASLRIQKRLGAAFQIGLEYGEFRQWNNNSFSLRNTSLSFGYAWDNGSLLNTRSFIAPYHIVKVGSSVMQASSEVGFENSNFLLGTENGLKFRLGDRWSAQLSLDLFWVADYAFVDRIFEGDFNYGYNAGISYHFGAVKTNYKAPVFNARRPYAEPSEKKENETAQKKPAPKAEPKPESSPRQSQERELIDEQNRLIENQNEFIGYLLQSERQSERKTKTAEADSIDYLYYHRFPKGEVPDTALSEEKSQTMREKTEKVETDTISESMVRDTVLTRVEPEEKAVDKISADSLKKMERDTLYLYNDATDSSVDSLTEMRVDSAGKALPADTVYIIREVPTNGGDSESKSESDNSSLEKRMDDLESENAKLRREVEEAANSESTNTETKTETNTITERVIVQEEGRKTNNTVIPVPVPTGGKNKDQKEVLENQKRLEGQIDSLGAKIDRMGDRPSTSAVDSTNIEYIVTPTTTYPEMPVGNSSISDSTSINSIDVSGVVENYRIKTPLKAFPESHFIAPLFKLPLTKMGEISTKKSSLSSPSQKAGSPGNSGKSDVTPESEKSKGAATFSAAYPVKVLFDLNSHNLPSSYLPEINDVVKDLRENPGAEIVITGYTDKSGDPDYNKMLSEKRAVGVKNYLVEKGVAEDKIAVEAAGNKDATEAYNKGMRKVEIALSK
ncbi:MAG: OmpA family protein [Flavobacteriales bacterium]|nr:OmpA family protein [Flavobacteriales bacterium]